MEQLADPVKEGGLLSCGAQENPPNLRVAARVCQGGNTVEGEKENRKAEQVEKQILLTPHPGNRTAQLPQAPQGACSEPQAGFCSALASEEAAW